MGTASNTNTTKPPRFAPLKGSLGHFASKEALADAIAVRQLGEYKDFYGNFPFAGLTFEASSDRGRPLLAQATAITEYVSSSVGEHDIEISPKTLVGIMDAITSIIGLADLAMNVDPVESLDMLEAAE